MVYTFSEKIALDIGQVLLDSAKIDIWGKAQIHHK
jgi:hypothetical protein